MDIILILALALIIDLVFGDPPDAYHPVAWMGKTISFLERVSVGRRSWSQFTFGLVMTLLLVALFAVPVYLLLAYLEGINFAAYIIIGAVLLKLSFSLSGLRKTALKIKELLKNKRLNEARFELRSLVSRDVSHLSRPLLVSATVESVAESTCDSFVAPLFYFLFFGVPGVIAYRAVSTLDSMIGYRGRYEYLGKFASRLDDVLNYVPARLTALLLVMAAFFCGYSTRRSWQVTLSDHAKTESPNAGWPMAAMAGALSIRLTKIGHYELGKVDTPLVPATISVSLKLVQAAAASWILVCFTVGVLYCVYTT